MTEYTHWNKRFDSLIRFAAPELSEADKPTGIYAETIADTGINPDVIIWIEVLK